MTRETTTSRSIYARYGKRALDLFLSATGLLVLSPLLLIVACCIPELLVVLAARTGMTDPASLAYQHEEELLAGHHDPEEFYRSQVLPDKLALNYDYIQKISLKADLRIIIRTLVSSFFVSIQ